MIKVSRLNGKEFYVNPDLIEFIEETPDTVVTLTTGKKIIVEENASVMLDRIVEYKRSILEGLPTIIKQSMEA